MRVATICRKTSALLLVALLAACAAKQPAPVSDIRATAPAARPPVTGEPAPKAEPAPAAASTDTGKVHVIQRGDTLIGIAFQNGLDYRDLAAWNGIDNPNVIKLGQSLRLTAPGTVTAAASGTQPKPGEPVATPLVLTPPLPSATPIPASPVAGNPPATAPLRTNTDTLKTEPRGGKVPYTDAAYAKLTADASAASAANAPLIATPPVITPPPSATATPPPTTPPATSLPVPPIASAGEVDWAWPIQPAPKGRIIAGFTEANRGIDISGAKNSPVLAAATGKVVHTGAGLRGYGRLIIIKHNDNWLSAYAHNEKILVAQGQEVKKGLQIAEMGSSDADQVKLHFEIRRQGKPVDPVKLLPN